MYELKTIEDTHLLSGKQMVNLEEIKADLVVGFEDIITRRSKYLMEVSVLTDTKFPTPDAKYWQAILERDVQFRNMLSESFDYQEKEAEVQILNIRYNNLIATDTELSLAKANKLQIQIRREEMDLTFMQKNASERYDEIINWTDIINDLKPQLKYNGHDQNEHMSESYLIKFALETQMIKELGASDMNGAMNILGLGQSALKHFNEKVE